MVYRRIDIFCKIGVEETAIANGLEADAALPAGRRVKVPLAEPYRAEASPDGAGA